MAAAARRTRPRFARGPRGVSFASVGPAIVIDPKGENYAVTTRRRLQFGQRVALLDPFGVTGSRILDTLNPLDLISSGDNHVDDAAVVAKLITRGGLFPTDPFWDERAESLITGLILHVLKSSPGPVRTLGEVRRLLETSERELMNHAVEMQHRGASTEIKAAANKRRLASRLGMTPENLSRTFVILRQHGVKLQQSRIVVSDPASLTQLAGPDDTIDHHRM